MHYVDVHDGCSITVLYVYFTKCNVRTVTNLIASKYAELCDLITMEPLILFYFYFHSSNPTFQRSVSFPVKYLEVRQS